MKTDINYQDLFAEIFNSNIFEKDHLWDNFLSYDFSTNELEYIEKMKNEAEIYFKGIPDDTLLKVFYNYFHHYGFFEKQFDNFQDGWYYATVVFFFNDNLDIGYIYTPDDHEIILFRSFSNGEKIFESLSEGWL